LAYRTLIIALATAFCLFLGGCNKLRLGYEYADWLVIYSVEDNFDLDRPQRVSFKNDVEAYFRWHRKAMLPKYAELLSGAADSLGKGLRPAGIDSAYDAFKRLRRETMEPTLDRSVNLLLSLAPAQVEAWHAKQRKKNQKLRKDFSGTLDERLERRYEKTVDELEDWTGRLTKAQKNQIREISRGLPWNGNFWLENRERMQDSLATLLRSKAPREDVRRLLEDYFIYPERLRSPEYQAAFERSESGIRRMIVRIHALLTPQQRKHFRGLVENLAQDFHKMSRQD
jgi:hypothetical protein